MQFDSRGQAVWEWAVKTGMFDRNASTQRIKALVETPLSLSEDPKPAPDGQAPKASTTAASPSTAPTKPTEASSRRGGGNPYERAEPVPKLQPGENTGFDPYSSGPSRPRGSR